MMMTNNTGYVLFSTGDYSECHNTAFKVLKPFSFAETAAKFEAQWSPPDQWQKRPRPQQYIDWLFSQGFIDDATEIKEVHVGSYDFDDGREYIGEVAGVIFYPQP